MSRVGRHGLPPPPSARPCTGSARGTGSRETHRAAVVCAALLAAAPLVAIAAGAPGADLRKGPARERSSLKKPARARTPRPAESKALSAAPEGIRYTLGPETVPNGAFDHVGPRWQQLRPDEGEKLAVVPQGWLVGYQGGERRMPIPGVDPDTGGRCMVFLYGAGRVDLLSPSFPLPGEGTYVLSARTRSVVNPSDHALRVAVRLFPPDDAPASAGEQVVERLLAAGPPERAWATRGALIEVPPGLTRAEVHLIKDDALADFLVDDVSLRRIESAPTEFPIDVPAREERAAGDAESWLSPVVYLGAVATVTLEIESAGAAPGVTVETRTGLTAEPGAAWEDWLRYVQAAEGSHATPVHTLADGLPIYFQVRVRLAPDAGGTGAAGAAPAASPGPVMEAGSGVRSIIVRTTVSARKAVTRRIAIESIQSGPYGAEGWSSLALPDAGACTEGALQPVRALALRATAGIEGDLPRARALAGALRQWAPFTAGSEPPEGSASPDPMDLLEDCRRPTPLHCRGWEADLLTAACRCLGMICRAVSSAAAGESGPGLEGIDVWSNDLERWVFLDPTAAGAAREAADDRALPGASAVALASGQGKSVAVATDLRWGRRGWLIFGPSAHEADDEDSLQRARGGAEEIDFPLNHVHLDLAAAGERSFEVRLGYSMPDFRGYLHRFSPSASWADAPDPLVWRLVPGENLLEVRARNGTGGLGPAAAVRARLLTDRSERTAAYSGLHAFSGDPHVHTGLGLYRILDPDSPIATGTPEGAFASAVLNGLDWAAVTDFSAHLDDPRTREWRRSTGHRLRNPDGSETESEWDHLKAAVRAADKPGRFAAFLGVEFDGDGYSSKGGTGRKLILLPDESATAFCSPRIENGGDCPVLEDAYRFARANGGVMIAATPCRGSGPEDTDWSRQDGVVALMEIYGGACEKGPGGFVDVTARRGLLVGAGGGGDSRGGSAGEWDRTICWARELTRASILEAMRARRCYWSAAGSLELAFTLNGAPMGSEIPVAEVTAWSVTAENRTAPSFGYVEVLRDGEVVASAPCESASMCFLEGGVGESGPGVYYAAVSASDGTRLAVSSPIRALPAPVR